MNEEGPLNFPFIGTVLWHTPFSMNLCFHASPFPTFPIPNQEENLTNSS